MELAGNQKTYCDIKQNPIAWIIHHNRAAALKKFISSGLISDTMDENYRSAEYLYCEDPFKLNLPLRLAISDMLQRQHGDTRILKLLLDNCLDISNPHSSIGRHLIRFTMTLLGGIPYWSVPSPSLLSIIPAPPPPLFSEKKIQHGSKVTD